MQRRTLTLDRWQRLTLERMRDHHPTPYLRERAAALLKIADGMSPHAVARHGLLKRRKPDTVYTWLNGYQQHGLTGLYHKPRRRRGFSPRPDRRVARDVAPSPHEFWAAPQPLDP